MVWKSLWGSGSGYTFFHASLPPSPGAFMMSHAMQSQTRIETRNEIDFNFISPCIANRWVWMMERVGRRRGFWKGERPSANKFLCKIPNFAFDCPDQCGIGKQFAFVKNIFANKYILLQIDISKPYESYLYPKNHFECSPVSVCCFVSPLRSQSRADVQWDFTTKLVGTHLVLHSIGPAMPVNLIEKIEGTEEGYIYNKFMIKLQSLP